MQATAIRDDPDKFSPLSHFPPQPWGKRRDYSTGQRPRRKRPHTGAHQAIAGRRAEDTSQRRSGWSKCRSSQSTAQVSSTMKTIPTAGTASSKPWRRAIRSMICPAGYWTTYVP